ncbi:MAG: glycine cleavage system aminomethyltransferase GcvT [bacterium]
MNDAAPSLQNTPLTTWHEANAGKMVPFAGFIMPVQYRRGVLAEHAAVRERVGCFDISHMGEIAVVGEAAEPWLDGLFTNKLAGLAPGRIVYGAMCREGGGVLDDLLVYRLTPERWFVVCNAVNREKIVQWLETHLPPSGVSLSDLSEQTALIAVQGPAAPEVMARLEALAPHRQDVAELKYYTGMPVQVGQAEWVVSRTGYTGERGYEIYVPNDAALPLWEEILAQGADFGIEPVGLAARDTLRFEVGYCLYGHELGEDISPLEAGIGWAVKFKKGDYVGKETLAAQKAAGLPRRLIGLEVEGRTIARQATPVLVDEQRVGAVTSGSYSPTLKRSLALALVATPPAADGFQVEIRGRRVPCRRVPSPFLPARVKGDPRAERGA